MTPMSLLGLVLVAVPVAVGLYAYVFYPIMLLVIGWARRYRVEMEDPPEWPAVTLTVPAYNEEASIAATLERLLEVDYPPERLHILVISDASTDRTDEIVKGFASRHQKP